MVFKYSFVLVICVGEMVGDLEKFGVSVVFVF